VRSFHLSNKIAWRRGGSNDSSHENLRFSREQQFRWYTAVDSANEELVRLNQPAEEFEAVKEEFRLNLDEFATCAQFEGRSQFEGR
jgi:hypothetical protein